MKSPMNQDLLQVIVEAVHRNLSQQIALHHIFRNKMLTDVGTIAESHMYYTI